MTRDVTGRGEEFEAFVRRWQGKSREEFLATCRAPIVLRSGALSNTPSLFTTHAPETAPAGPAPALHVLELRKTAGNPFAAMLTVGRAPNNDLVLDDPTVSKFHAYFQETPEGWAVVDARSTNGTFVAGCRLEPRVPRLVELGARPFEVTFGTVVCSVYPPERFHELMTTTRATIARAA